MKRFRNKHKINPVRYSKQSNGVNTPLKMKVLVAMSGGVDSSVTAKLLKDAGHEVAGVFLNFWKEESRPACSPAENKCCSSEALRDAKAVAAKIGIPLHTLDFSELFKKQVVDNFLAEYGNGRTPNPCVRCNKAVKLGYLIKEAKKSGFDYVASGHYARIKKTRTSAGNNKFIYQLRKAKDKDKDQSYFLYALNQNELSRLLFPLGDYTKRQVRQMAKKFKLPVALKKDSQEVCFIPEKTPHEFLKRHLKLKPGPIKLASLAKGGRGVIGYHAGLPLYTIGQRKGLRTTVPGPFYVVKKNNKANTLYVVKDKNSKELHKNSLIAKNINWQVGNEPILPLKCQAVIRYGQKPIKCQVKKIKGSYSVKFDKPVRAIAPGQSAVFYLGKEVLGGGIIK